MKKAAALFALFIFIPALLFAAGTVTLTSDDTESFPGGKTWRILEWTITTTAGQSTATGGSATGVAGKIIGVHVEPDATNRPDDDWDLDVLDATSTDVCQSDLDNLPRYSTDNGCLRYPVTDDAGASIYLFNENLSLSVTNFNSAGTATSVLFMYIELP